MLYDNNSLNQDIFFGVISIYSFHQECISDDHPLLKKIEQIFPGEPFNLSDLANYLQIKPDIFNAILCLWKKNRYLTEGNVNLFFAENFSFDQDLFFIDSIFSGIFFAMMAVFHERGLLQTDQDEEILMDHKNIQALEHMLRASRKLFLEIKAVYMQLEDGILVETINAVINYNLYYANLSSLKERIKTTFRSGLEKFLQSSIFALSIKNLEECLDNDDKNDDPDLIIIKPNSAQSNLELSDRTMRAVKAVARSCQSIENWKIIKNKFSCELSMLIFIELLDKKLNDLYTLTNFLLAYPEYKKTAINKILTDSQFFRKHIQNIYDFSEAKNQIFLTCHPALLFDKLLEIDPKTKEPDNFNHVIKTDADLKEASWHINKYPNEETKQIFESPTKMEAIKKIKALKSENNIRITCLALFPMLNLPSTLLIKIAAETGVSTTHSPAEREKIAGEWYDYYS